jgi:hypothetical protein
MGVGRLKPIAAVLLQIQSHRFRSLKECADEDDEDDEDVDEDDEVTTVDSTASAGRNVGTDATTFPVPSDFRNKSIRVSVSYPLYSRNG